MSGLIIIFAIFIFSTLLSIVSSQGPLYSRKSRWGITFTNNGAKAFFLVIVVLALSSLQFYLNQQEATRAKREADAEAKKREDTLRADYQKSVLDISIQQEKMKNATVVELRKNFDTSTTNIVKALATYGLKYDSAKNRIENIVKDSIKTTPDPVITFGGEMPIEVKPDLVNGLVFKFTVVSRDAASRDLKLNSAACMANEMAGPYIFIAKGPFYHTIGKLASGEEREISDGVLGHRFKKLIFYRIYGTYKSLKNDLPISMDQVLVYNIESNKL